jgi:hypothetical protein
MDPASQYALAYALSTTAGVRALLPLAAVAVAAHAGIVHPPSGFAWLGSTGAMWVLLVAALVEILADKLPLVDHGMHVLGVVSKPAAAAILVGGSLHGQPQGVLITLMVLGALNALGVHAAVASVRGASTIATAGVANPVVSMVEDAGTVGSLVLAYLVPFVAALLALCCTTWLFVLARHAYRRVRAGRIA